MKRYIIDTNALVSFVTDRNPTQQQAVAPIFAAAAHLEARIICLQHVLTEFIYVMEKIYSQPKKQISTMVLDFIQMPGVEIVHEVNLKSALSCWPDPIHDFGEALVAALAMAEKSANIVTFDRRFAAGLKKLGIGASF
jgi:predicted nucleic-acid-binding protein